MNAILNNNITDFGRAERLFVGIVLISGVMFFSNEVPAWISLFAVYPIITAIMGWDPIYASLLKLRSLVGPLGHNRKAPMAS